LENPSAVALACMGNARETPLKPIKNKSLSYFINNGRVVGFETVVCGVSPLLRGGGDSTVAYEGRGHKFLEYRALRYNFQACYSGPLKPSWWGNSHFRDWLPVVIGLFSEWRADVTVSFRRLDGYMPCIPGTFDRVLRRRCLIGIAYRNRRSYLRFC
jgi:hypothetical protein